MRGRRGLLDADTVVSERSFEAALHHGNSTNQVFDASNQVLFISIHQSPLFPGTGPADDVGEGEGRGFTVNLPVLAGSGDEVWVSLVERVVVPLARAFEPQLVLVCAGYDAHRDDLLADCAVTERGSRRWRMRWLERAGRYRRQSAACWRGGYALGALGRSVAATLQALSTPASVAGSARAPQAGVTPIAGEARDRLANGGRSSGGETFAKARRQRLDHPFRRVRR